MPPVQTFAGLSLTQLADVIAASAYHAYSHALSASAASSLNAAPGTNAYRYFKWCTTPKVGQLVVEVTTLGLRPAIDRLGVLLSVTSTPYPDWDEELNGPPSSRDVFRLMRLTGETIDWENCSLIAVPKTSDFRL